MLSKLEKAKLSILRDRSNICQTLAPLLQYVDIVRDKNIQTALVCPYADSFQIRYNPNHYKVRPFNHFKWDILHELLHIVKQHMFISPKKYDISHETANCAMDMEINTYIRKCVELDELWVKEAVFPKKEIPHASWITYIPEAKKMSKKSMDLVFVQGGEGRVSKDMTALLEKAKEETFGSGSNGEYLDIIPQKDIPFKIPPIFKKLYKLSEKKTRVRYSCHTKLNRVMGDYTTLFEKKRRDTKKAIYFLCDTSSSMREEKLMKVLSCLQALVKEHHITIVYWDDMFHKKYEYKGVIEPFVGRGGTDMLAGIKYCRKFTQNVVVYTDGGTDYNKSVESPTLLWLLVERNNVIKGNKIWIQ